MRRLSALVSSSAIVVALAIERPTAAFSPDSGTSSATRWRAVSVGRTSALGPCVGAGVGPVRGPESGTTLHAARKTVSNPTASARLVNANMLAAPTATGPQAPRERHRATRTSSTRPLYCRDPDRQPRRRDQAGGRHPRALRCDRLRGYAGYGQAVAAPGDFEAA